MRDRVDPAAVHAGHVPSGDHGVHDGLLGGLHDPFEERVQIGVRQDPQSSLAALVGGGLLVGGRERHENVAGAVHRDAPQASESQGRPAGNTFQLVREERRVGGRDDDDGSVPSSPGGGRTGFRSRRVLGKQVGNLPPYGHPGDAELRAPAEVGLHEDAHRVVRPAGPDPARGGADSRLELEGAHSGAASHRPLLDRSAAGGVQRGEHVLAADVEAGDVVQESVPGLGDHRQRPGAKTEVRLGPGDRRLVDRADAVGVRDEHRPLQDPPVADPGGSGHLSVPVQGEPVGEHSGLAHPPTRQHRGDPGPDRPLLPEDGRVSHFQSGNVGDGVQRTRVALEGHPQIPGAGRRLGESAGSDRGDHHDGAEHAARLHRFGPPAGRRRPVGARFRRNRRAFRR